MTITKIDLKRVLHELYEAGPAPSLVHVPPLSYLMVEGRGVPLGPGFQEAMQALYAMSYTLKFELKQSDRLNWVVAPLEALWGNVASPLEFATTPPSLVRWKAMIVQPEEVSPEDVERSRGEVSARRDLPALSRLTFESYDEGLSAQILHVGPYAEEHVSVARLQAFLTQQGYRPRLAHHEIYLSDPMKAVPQRLRTIIRQPVAD